MIGQPELNLKIQHTRLTLIRDCIGVRGKLSALTPHEVEEYILHRLEIAGHQGPGILSKSVIQLIASASGGIPRRINTICDNALLIGFALEKRRIDKNIIREVTYDLDGGRGSNRTKKRNRHVDQNWWAPRSVPTLGALVFALLVMVVASYLILDHHASDSDLDDNPKSIQQEGVIRL